MGWWSKLWKALESSPPIVPEKPLSEIPRNVPSLHTCIHEAGHYMVAWLFPEKLRINEINADNSTFTDGRNGQLHITRLTDTASAGFFDQLMLTYCGGLCAAPIHSKGIEFVKANFWRFPRNTEGINVDGASGDYEEIQKLAFELADPNGLDKTRLMWNGFQYVFMYLMNPVIWQSIQVIAAAVQQKDSFRMSHAEIEKLLAKKIGLRKLKKERTDFLNIRYPLTLAKVQQLLPAPYHF